MNARKIIRLAKKTFLSMVDKQKSLSNASLPVSDESCFAGLLELIDKNGSIPYSILFILRLIEEALEIASANDGKNYSIKDARILELGSSPAPTLAIACLLLGAKRFTANNVVTVARSLHSSQCSLAFILLGGRQETSFSTLDQICAGIDNDGNRTLDPRLFRVFAPVAGEDLPDDAGKADLVLSFSVLEHVKNPRELIKRAFQLTAPGGLHIHSIDLRDHSDFSHPLDFLKLSEAEYWTRPYSGENRLRSCDFLDIFMDIGFRILYCRWMDSPPNLNALGDTSLLNWWSLDINSIWSAGSMEEIRPWVDSGMRDNFVYPWNKMPINELSAIGLFIIAKRPLD